jgi:hypothetical protein
MTFFESGTGAVIVSSTTALAAFSVVALGELRRSLGWAIARRRRQK